MSNKAKPESNPDAIRGLPPHDCNLCGARVKTLPYLGKPERFNKWDEAGDIDGSGHITNGDRAARAERALVAWRGSDVEDESAIRDCICDLLHLAHREGYDPIWDADMGVGMWREESRNEGAGI